MIRYRSDKGLFNFRVAGVLILDDKILLQRGLSDPSYALPGGQVEFAEDSETALRREFLEEISAQIKIIRLLWVNENFYDEKDGKHHELCFYYLITLSESDKFPRDRVFYTNEEDESRLKFHWQDIDKLGEIQFYPAFAAGRMRDLPTKIEHVVSKYADAATHYDLMVDEGFDFAKDTPLLSDYMNKWDGLAFIGEMRLTGVQDVLEIGVGTGRLALRVAGKCGTFTGIDISQKTIDRAKENLASFKNSDLICGDFMDHPFDRTFDVIYSSQTFMHIADKAAAIRKIADLLKCGGRFVLSIDKNKDDIFDFKSRQITLYPDDPDSIDTDLKNANLDVVNRFETEFAVIFVSVKGN